MKFELMHPADQLVLLMDRIYHHGMTTTSGGNLSIRDENGDVWITPKGIDKGTLTRQDIVRVRADGEVVGIHEPSSELPFHQDIYRKRPDIRAVAHAHPPCLVGFSLARIIPNTFLTPNTRLVCGDVAMAAYEVPGSVALGANIAKEFLRGVNCVMLENHGVVCGGPDIFTAFMRFETLENAARLQLDANAIGTLRPLTPEQANGYEQIKRAPAMDSFIPKVHSSEEREARREMCTLIHRAYNQKLFSSTQGTFSQRLSDGSFVITPYQMDRMYLEPDDLALIRGDMCEAGKSPSRSVLLHKRIYDQHPEVGSIIIAHPPAIMAFACTDAKFDSRTIPESYILLRDVVKLPFGTCYADIQGTSDVFVPHTPVVLVENDCAIVTGSTLINAFDRLEVLEYSAKALINVQNIGSLMMIDDAQVRDIEIAFNLEP